MVDVLVAGAGPAGTAAAMVLARAGARVLIVDRHRFPRPKMCGDTLNPGALSLLDRLGLRAEVESRGRPLDGMRVTAASGWSVSATYSGWKGLAITRLVLDAVLLEAAARAGAQVQEQVRVVRPILDNGSGSPGVRGATLRTTGGLVRVPARLTIAADGRSSTLGRALRLTSHPERPRRWAVGAYFTGVAGPPPAASDSRVDGDGAFGEMHIRRGHYVGVAPVTTEMTNACVVTADRDRLGRPLVLLDEVLATDPVLRDRFRHAVRVSDVSCLGPLAVEARACGVDGLLLAGDAAGFVDPMTGDGLRFAIEGGVLAAQAALEWFDAPQLAAHRRLSRLRRRAFGRKQLMNRTLRQVVGSAAAVSAGEVAAQLFPAVVRAIIRAAGDVPRAPDPVAVERP